MCLKIHTSQWCFYHRTFFENTGLNSFLWNALVPCWHSQLRYFAWWRHQMETFSALLAICAGNSPVPGEFPAQRPVTRSFDIFFDLRLNKRLSKQSWGWWFETLLCPLSRHCNGRDVSSFVTFYCPACRTSLIATRFWVVVICPIIKCFTVLEFSFILFYLCLFITIFNFILNYVPIVTFWIFTYHKIWILLIIFCFIWSYWIIYFSTCLEVFWSVVS